MTERRRIDGRYQFYLDCFFLVKKEGETRVLAEPLPAVFPKNLDDRSMNRPFPSIDDMLIRVRDNPGSTAPLVELSLVYTMLGDNLNAIKYLNAAALIAPKDPDITLLAAKNRIWKGDTAEGLRGYRALLDADPSRRELWLEAGKVAAWTGRYDDSVRFLTDGLAAFPKDLDLTVNLGLTYLWSSRGQDAERIFREAQAIAGSDAARLVEIARIYRVNSYPDRAIAAYNAAIAAAPQDLQARLLLIDTLQSLGRTADAESEQRRIVETFVPSPRLDALLASFREKQGLKEQVLAEYRQKLADNPDNLVLRQTLAQAYFWNGQKDTGDRGVPPHPRQPRLHRRARRRGEGRGRAAGDRHGPAARRLPRPGAVRRAPEARAAFRRRVPPGAGGPGRGGEIPRRRARGAGRGEGGDGGGEGAGSRAGGGGQAARGRARAGHRRPAPSLPRVADARSSRPSWKSSALRLPRTGTPCTGLQEKDAAAEEAFRAAAQPGGWTFERAATLAECRAISRTMRSPGWLPRRST